MAFKNFQQQSRDPKAPHAGSCRVCLHPDKREIESAYRERTSSLRDLTKEFGLAATSLKNHAAMFPHLQRARNKNLLSVLDMALEEAIAQIPKMDFKPQHIADLVLKRAQVSGTLVHLTADVSKRYAGRSDDDLLYMAEHGEWPEDSHPTDPDSPDLMKEPARPQ